MTGLLQKKGDISALPFPPKSPSEIDIAIGTEGLIVMEMGMIASGEGRGGVSWPHIIPNDFARAPP